MHRACAAVVFLGHQLHMPSQERIRAVDASSLEAALIGFEQMKRNVEEKMTEIRQRLSSDGGAPGTSPGRTQGRTRSAAVRRRMAAAQRKRWAAVKAKLKPSKPTTSKRTMSAAARKRIAAAQRKRWALAKAKKAS
jgi:hypothetical protein